MTVIGVPYHLDEYLPDLDLTPEPAELITPELPAGEIWSRLAALYTAVARAVTRGRADDGRPVVVASGDCLTALGAVAGLQAAGADPAVVWFDAHGDVQTPETTSSGYLAGMSLRLLTGYRPELIASRLGLRPVSEDRIVLVGARDLDPPEVTYLDRAPIRRRQVTDLSGADLPDGPLYVHVDLDVIDAAQPPRPALPHARRPGRRTGRGRAEPAVRHRPRRGGRHRLQLVPRPRGRPPDHSVPGDRASQRVRPARRPSQAAGPCPSPSRGAGWHSR